MRKQDLDAFEVECAEALKEVAARHGFDVVKPDGGRYYEDNRRRSVVQYTAHIEFANQAARASENALALERHGLRLGAQFEHKGRRWTIAGWNPASKYSVVAVNGEDEFQFTPWAPALEAIKTA
jgi:hypothetical protein